MRSRRLSLELVVTLLVVLVVSGALLVGAAWGIYGTLPDWIDGFLVALAGGALLLSVTSELIQPSIEKSSLWVAAGGVRRARSSSPWRIT